MAVSQSLTLTKVANSTNVANNTSQVRILWQSTQTGESWNGYTRTAKYWISINGGTEKEYTVSYTLPQYKTKTILDKTITVDHKNDGSGTVKVRTWMDTDISAGIVELNKSLTLDTIPRASTITSVSDVSVGGNYTVKWTPKSKSFRYKLKIEVGTWSYTTGIQHPNQTTEYSYTNAIPVEVANQLPNGTGTMKATLYSYSDSNASKQIGSANSKTSTITIPASMASTITSASNVTLGNKCSVKWTPQATSFRYKLKFKINNWEYTTGAIHPNKTTEYTYSDYTIPLDAAWQFTSKTYTMTVTLYSYSDSGATKQIGTVSDKTPTVTVPETDATKPTVATMSVAPVSSLNSPFNTMYIQGHCKVKASLTFGLKLAATVAASNITVDGKTYESPYESGILTKSGTLSIKATVKDSRGFYGTNSREIYVIPYDYPYLRANSNWSEIVAARCDSSGKLTDSGTYLKIMAKVVYAKVISNGTQYNYGKISYRYRKEGGAYSAWQTILDSKTQTSDEVITSPLLNGALDAKSNYQVQIRASDELCDGSPITIAVPSDTVYMHRPAGGKSMGLGGYSTGDGLLDVYWRTMARGGLSLFDSGNEIPLESTTPLPRDLLPSGYDIDNLSSGIYSVAQSVYGIIKDKYGNDILYNGILMQLQATIDNSVRLQLVFPNETNMSPKFRIKWYGAWCDWRIINLKE